MTTRVVICLLWLAFPHCVAAADVVLTWDASPGATGYRIYHGVASGQYGTPGLDVGLETTGTVSQLAPGATYYFVVTAYNAESESGHSNEVSKHFPLAAPAPPRNVRTVVTIDVQKPAARRR